MNRFFLITLFLGLLTAIPCALHSQVIIKDFQQMENVSKTVQQTVTVVEGEKVPYVADITKLKRTEDLPLEERKALEEEFAPDSVYIRKLKQQDQAIFQQLETQKTGKSGESSVWDMYRKRWFPQEDKKE